MCILILRGPQADPAPLAPMQLPECAGRALRTLACADVDSLIAELHAAGGDAEVELVLLDSGDLPCPSAAARWPCVLPWTRCPRRISSCIPIPIRSWSRGCMRSMRRWRW